MTAGLLVRYFEKNLLWLDKNCHLLQARRFAAGSLELFLETTWKDTELS